ncbi:unnamed protein product, partial [Linum tenue]
SDGPQTLLKLRLLNAWGSYGLKNPTLIFNYCTLWNDEEGTLIQGTAPSELTRHFSPLLQLGSVYFVSNFRVKPPAPSYRSCSHKLTIILSAATQFEDVTRSSPSFWPDAFEFTPFSSLHSRIRSSVYLTDVVGAVVSITGVSSTVTSFGTTVRSDLVLQNENHMFLDISLWSDIARNLNGQELAVLGRSGPVMLAVCSLRVTGATKGGYSLTSTPGTRCVLNPVSEMAHLVQSVFFASTNTCQYYPPRFATPNEAAAFEAECTKTVSQLLALCFPPVADSTRYHCSGRIVSVDSSMQWYYLGCALCSKAAIDYDGVDKWCDDHRRLVPQQTQNFYKLRVTVDDNTGSAAFVLLGRAADLLVGLTANDLSTRFPYQRNVLPQELLALEGRDFTFDVQLPKPEYGARGPPEFTVLAVNEQEQPNSCSPTLGRRARNAMPHTPPPNSPHLMPLTSPYVVPTMQNASVEHG